MSFPLSATTNSRLSFSAGRPQFSQSLTSQDDQVSGRVLVAHGNEGDLLTYFYSFVAPLPSQRNLQIQVQTTTDTKTDHDHHGVVDEVCSPLVLLEEWLSSTWVSFRRRRPGGRYTRDQRRPSHSPCSLGAWGIQPCICSVSPLHSFLSPSITVRCVHSQVCNRY